MATTLFIKTKREGYTPAQCGQTMTVGELAALLEYFEDDTPIYFDNDNGYTFGSLTEANIEEVEDYGDE